MNDKITVEREGIDDNVTVRRYYDDGKFFRADVFFRGARIGQYKTEAGAMRRIAKETNTPL